MIAYMECQVFNCLAIPPLTGVDPDTLSRRTASGYIKNRPLHLTAGTGGRSRHPRLAPRRTAPGRSPSAPRERRVRHCRLASVERGRLLSGRRYHRQRSRCCSTLSRSRPEQVQVCESLGEPQTRKRETAALSEAMAELGLKTAAVVTRNEDRGIDTGGSTIGVVPAWRYLLDLPNAAA